ncbi:hypothetical protein FACS1894126_2680 [Alphaproteobacteria bacterium]|nr:hypothetical protein FACS1894126_2680 [Alphaproteobacteria bacterium]
MSKNVLGIDVGKQELALALLKDERFFSKTVPNSEAGFKAIENFVSLHTSTQPEAYMEATGNYSTSVADYLVDGPFKCEVHHFAA